MKAVSRTVPPPSCIDNNDKQVRAKKERLYATKTPWDGFSEKTLVRDELLRMFNEECAFCGKRLLYENTDTQVDHFLPQKRFKFLSLCWENMILLCSNCNNKKWNFSPESLNGKTFVENFMEAPQGAEVFDRNVVFSNCFDRLIDPSFDYPPDHISFDPASRQFEPSTPIGKLTVERIFGRLKGFDKYLKELSDEMKNVVEKEPHPEQIRDYYINNYGYSFFRREFYKYWFEMKQNSYVSTSQNSE